VKTEEGIVFEPEELSLLGGIYDQAIASLPWRMQTRANREAIAKNLMSSAASGERDRIELELAAFRDLTVNAAA
jgi:hypothetical protein